MNWLRRFLYGRHGVDQLSIVPRGKGKVSITCPKCREKFMRKV